jgi:RNA polymerase sigma factor (sigma-70 family)
VPDGRLVWNGALDLWQWVDPREARAARRDRLSTARARSASVRFRHDEELGCWQWVDALKCRLEPGESNRPVLVELYAKDREAMVGYALKQLLKWNLPSPHHLAEDVVQNTFVTALTWIYRIEQPKAFLYRLIRTNVWHEARRRSLVPVGDASTLERAQYGTDERAETRFMLHDAMRRLPPAPREAVWRACADEDTQAEVATDMGIPIGTVSTHIRRGKRRLAELLPALAMVLFTVGTVASAGFLAFLVVRYLFTGSPDAVGAQPFVVVGVIVSELIARIGRSRGRILIALIRVAGPVLYLMGPLGRAVILRGQSLESEMRVRPPR